VALAFGDGDPGTAPAGIRFTPGRLEFGNVLAGTSKDLVFEMSNSSASVIEGTFNKALCDEPSMPGIGNPCWYMVGAVTYRLDPGATTTITVRMAPYNEVSQCGLGGSQARFELPHGVMQSSGNWKPLRCGERFDRVHWHVVHGIAPASKKGHLA
jgi:hypothetical protein